jgi:hypothetical protein
VANIASASILQLPTDELVEWLRNHAPRALVDEAIPAAVIRARGFEPIMMRENRKRIVSVFTEPVTSKSLQDRLAKLFYVYEVAINDAFDSRKRGGDDGASEPKRSAAAAASSSDM